MVTKAARRSTSAMGVRRALSMPPSQAKCYRDGRFMVKMRSLLQNSPQCYWSVVVLNIIYLKGTGNTF